MWGVESNIQDGLRLTSSAQSLISIYISYFQLSRVEQANVFQILEYSFRDRVITAPISSVKIVLFFFFFFFQTVLNIAGFMLSRTSRSHCMA